MAATTGAVRAGRAFVEIFGDDSPLRRALDSAAQRVKTWGRDVSAIGSTLAMVGGGMVTGLLATTKMFADMGDTLEKASQRTGASVESLSKLGYAAEQSGTDLATVETAMRKMAVAIDEAGQGSKEAQDTLARLGVSAAELKAMTPDQQFLRMADALASIANPTERAAAAVAIFGRGGTALLPMLEGGRAGVEALMARAEQLGLVMSGEAARAAVVFGDTLSDLLKTTKMAVVEMGAALAPMLTQLAASLTSTATAVTQWIREHQQLVVIALQTGAAIAALGLALKGIAGVASIAAGALTLTTTAARALGVAFSFLAAHPVVAVLAGLVAAGTAVAAVFAAASAEADKFAQAAAGQGDQLRASHAEMMARLQQLAEKERLNNAEMAEAQKLVAALTAYYGDLGIALDETAGKITGVTEAQRKMSEAMKRQKIYDIESALREAREEAAQAEQDIRYYGEGWNARSVPGALGLTESNQQKQWEAMGRLEKTQAKILQLEQLLKAIREGEQPPVEGAKKPTGAPAAPAPKRYTDLEAAVRDAEIALIEDRYQQAIAREKEDYERRKAKSDGSDAALALLEREHQLRLQRIEQDRTKELAREQERQAAERERQEEMAAREREQQDEARARFEADISRQKAEFEIEQIADPRERERARIELEHERALAEARRVGADEAAVNTLYREKMRVAMAAGPSEVAAVAASTAGTFNAAAVGGLGMSYAARTAEATERMARDLAEIRRRRGLVAV